MRTEVLCEKRRCAYNENGTCGHDEIELGGHEGHLNRDRDATGHCLTCYSFELAEAEGGD